MNPKVNTERARIFRKQAPVERMDTLMFFEDPLCIPFEGLSQLKGAFSCPVWIKSRLCLIQTILS